MKTPLHLKTTPRATWALHIGLSLLAALFLTPFVSLLFTSVRNDAHAAAHPQEILPRAEYVRRPNGEWREIMEARQLVDSATPDSTNVRISNWSGSIDKRVTVPTSTIITRVGPTSRNYLHGWLGDGFGHYFWITALLCVVSVSASTFSSALVAYSCSILRWPGRDWVFYAVLVSLMLPMSLTVGPLYHVFHMAGLAGRYVPVVLPSLFGSAVSIILLRQFYLLIPLDLIEAARLEGSTEWQVFTKVVIPWSRPVLVLIGALAFFWQWSELLNPLIYLAGTVSSQLANLQGSAPGLHGELTAMCAVLIVPIALLVLLFRRSLIQGVDALVAACSSLR